MTQIMGSPNEANKGAAPGPDKDAEVQASLNRIKHKLVIMSGKGGVGKTSTSVNLAIALARLGHNVGLMDVDLHGPDVPRMLGLTAMLGLSANQKLDPHRVPDGQQGRRRHLAGADEVLRHPPVHIRCGLGRSRFSAD